MGITISSNTVLQNSNFVFGIESIASQVTLASIFTTGNFTNMWTSENVTIAGTDTTFHDYAGEHDLANPAASNQPTYNAVGSLGTNSRPSFTFNGTTDYLHKAVANWRGADSTGEVVLVFRSLGGGQIRVLTTADEASTTRFGTDGKNLGGGDVFEFYMFDTTNDRRMRGDTNIESGAPSLVYSYGTDASVYHIIGNETSETITAVAGSNDGAAWVGDIPVRDNISIGALIRSTQQYSNIEFCMAGYRPFTSIADSQNLQGLINTYYGIY